jgi:hypothetical protein
MARLRAFGRTDSSFVVSYPRAKCWYSEQCPLRELLRPSPFEYSSSSLLAVQEASIDSAPYMYSLSMKGKNRNREKFGNTEAEF